MLLILPELTIILTALAVLCTGIFSEKKQLLAPIAFAGIVAALAALAIVPHEGAIFGGRLAIDSVTWWFRLVFMLAGAVTVGLSADLFDGRAPALKMKLTSGELASSCEYYAVLLLNLVGMMFMASARDMVSLYIGLELATIPLFILAAWNRDHLSGEAGLKYLIIGALASALLLYGLSLLYGVSGEMQLELIGKVLKPSPILFLAIGFIIAGVGFKMTVAPFHMWAPEVYQGAPTPVTAYLSVASKAAGLALMFQLSFMVLGRFVDEAGWLFAILAALTMTIGNLVAIVQQNIKRFMAFSSISQAGYILIGFISPANESIAAMLFYIFVYLFTNFTVFTVIVLYSNADGREKIDDYKAIARSNPIIALAMMLGLFGLAGIPPLSGFVGKFFLFSLAAKAGFYWLVALAAVNSTISLYYYLRIVRQMYIEPLPVLANGSSVTVRITPVLFVVLAIVAAIKFRP